VSPSGMARMKEFYRTVLAPLDYKEMVHNDDNTLIGFGDGDHLPCLYLKIATDGQEFSSEYIAIDAKGEFSPPKKGCWMLILILYGADREEVRAFYNIAMYVGLGEADNYPFFHSLCAKSRYRQQGAQEKSKPNLGSVRALGQRCYTAAVIDPEGNELAVIDGTPDDDLRQWL
jgi:hypothetical protein